MDGEFLPPVEVTTHLWAGDTELTWYAALGDDLKKMIPMIELNLAKMVRDEEGDVEKVTELLLDNWLGMYIVLCTNQDLITKKIRGQVSGKGHQLLHTANRAAIKASPALEEHYTRVAIEAIRGARPYLALPNAGTLFQGVLDQFHYRLALMEADKVVSRSRAEQTLRGRGLIE